MKAKDKEIERLKRREEERKLGIKDYLNIDNEYDNDQDEGDNEIEKPPIRESMFKKLVNLTNINSSQSINEPNYYLYNKIKLTKESPNSNNKVTNKFYVSNLSQSNNKSNEHLIYPSQRNNNNSYQDNFYNHSKTPNKELYHFEFKEDKKKKEKQIKDRFYGEENKPDFFGLRNENKTTKVNKNYKLIKLPDKNINTDRNFISNSNSRTSIRANNMFRSNNQNINLRDRGFPNNFVMPINPMNDVLSAKVNYLYGDKY